MTPAELKSEIESLLRAGPAKWQSVQARLTPPIAWLLQQSLSNVPTPDVMATWRRQHHEHFDTSIAENRALLVNCVELLKTQHAEHKRWIEGNTEPLDEEFPAAEIHVYTSPLAAELRAKWQAAGGRVFDGRCVALKADPVWCRFSAFGQPHDPFTWDWTISSEDVSRDEAEELGLL